MSNVRVGAIRAGIVADEKIKSPVIRKRDPFSGSMQIGGQRRQAAQRESTRRGGGSLRRAGPRGPSRPRERKRQQQHQRVARAAQREQPDEQAVEREAGRTGAPPVRANHEPDQQGLEREEQRLGQDQRVEERRGLGERQHGPDEEPGAPAGQAARAVRQQRHGRGPEQRLRHQHAIQAAAQQRAQPGQSVGIERRQEEGARRHGPMAENGLGPVPVDLGVGVETVREGRVREAREIRPAPGSRRDEDQQKPRSPLRSGRRWRRRRGRLAARPRSPPHAAAVVLKRPRACPRSARRLRAA